MTAELHDEVRKLITFGGELSTAQQVLVRTHLDECAGCREYEETAGRVVAMLRSVPVTADSRLVRATQMRVRFHAAHLRESRERMWLVGLACLAVGLSASLTLPLLWQAFAWIGEQAGLSALEWQAGFVLVCVVPVLFVSFLLLERGTHLRSRADR